MIYFQLFYVFFKVGLFTFGGGLAMLPVIQREVVLRGWLTVGEFLDVVSIAQMTPGAISINTATYAGNKVAGVLGGIVASIGAVTPSVIVIIILSTLMVRFKGNKYKDAFFFGVKPITVGLVAYAGYTIGKGSFFPEGKISFSTIGIFIIAFTALKKFKMNPVYVIFISAGLGVLFL